MSRNLQLKGLAMGLENLCSFFQEHTGFEWVLRAEGMDSHFFGNINEKLFFVVSKQPNKFEGYEIVYGLEACGSGGTSPLFETTGEVVKFILQVIDKWDNGTLAGTTVIRVNY
jgi:hypothetical protein